MGCAILPGPLLHLMPMFAPCRPDIDFGARGHAPELRAHQFANGASAGLTEPDPDLVSVRLNIC